MVDILDSVSAMIIRGVTWKETVVIGITITCALLSLKIVVSGICTIFIRLFDTIMVAVQSVKGSREK